MPDRESVRTYSFRGHDYRIACTERDGYQHPSWFSFEDESSVRDAFWEIQPGDIVFDVGAAYGSYTLTALACGAKHVFSWSPEGPPGETSEADMLAKSLQLNGWTDRCAILRHGCYDRTGWLNPGTQEFSSTRADGTISVVRLDDESPRAVGVLEDSSSGPTRFWLKLDVEGAEVEVLRGGAQLIRTLRPRVVVENHLFKRDTIEREVRGFVLGMGYREVATCPYHSVSHSLYEPS